MSGNQIPAPLTPADCDLRGLDYMPLLGHHLFGSEFNARASDSEWRAAMTLWWAAWTQKPAASLPDDDLALCRLADLGRDLRAWKKVKAMALYGFEKCSDGRLYHKTLAEQALIAWGKRLKDRERKAEWRAKQVTQNQADSSNVPRDGTRTETGTERGRDAAVPADGNRRDGTVYSDTDVSAKSDPVKRIFDLGVALLVDTGSTPAAARSMIGRWRKEHSDTAVESALSDAKARNISDPRAWITARLNHQDAQTDEFYRQIELKYRGQSAAGAQ